MTIEDYMRNLRGVNDGSDFSTEYLVCDRGFGNDSGLLVHSSLEFMNRSASERS